MEQFIGCDAHKKFSVFVAVNGRHSRDPHRPDAWDLTEPRRLDRY